MAETSEARGRTFLGLILVAALAVSAGCGGSGKSGGAGTSAPAVSMSPEEAEARLKQIVLQLGDAGEGFTQDQAHVQTNEDVARARPDTEKARQQYADWGQILQYNVQYAAPATTELVFNAATARIANTATIFGTAEGAASALAYVRDLPANVVADFLVNDAAGTKITDTQVVKDIDFPAKADESFAWRVTGKAVFENGFTINFVADTVFLRAGNVNGNVTAVALGQPPQRDRLASLVDTFVERARAAAG